MNNLSRLLFSGKEYVTCAFDKNKNYLEICNSRLLECIVYGPILLHSPNGWTMA